MGAIERQVPQVKRKNSTNCKPPEARLTVVGSVAWRSGPREVATGRAVASLPGGTSAVGASVAAARVAVAKAAVEGSVAASGGFVTEDSEAHAAKRIAIKVTVRRDRFLIMFLLSRYSIKSLHKYYRLLS
jgi:hypothetical protein